MLEVGMVSPKSGNRGGVKKQFPVSNLEGFSMKRTLFTVAALTLVMGGVAQALSIPAFVNPPETTWSWWVTQPPYQRNIYWNFSVNPVGGPSPTGTPGAV